jgi:glucose/arabinose dehydrogenase
MRRLSLVLAVSALALGTMTAPAAFADSTTTTTSSTNSSTTTTTSAAPTTTTTQKPRWTAPLTGLPDPSELTRHRSALTIKIDNTPQPRIRSTACEDADVVYEEIVEGRHHAARGHLQLARSRLK